MRGRAKGPTGCMATTEPDRFASVFARAAASPWVAAPLLLGLCSLAVGWLLGGGGGFFRFLGGTGVFFAVGAAATRALLGRGAAGSSDRRRERLEAEQAEAALAELESRLQVDGDARTADFLRRLRKLQSRMRTRRIYDDGVPFEAVPEVRGNVEELYRACLHSLDRSSTLLRAAGEMATEASRETLRGQRERLLAELQEGIGRLEAAVDYLQAAELRPADPADALARLREELDAGLRIARRVDERMDAFDRPAPPSSRARRLDAEGL